MAYIVIAESVGRGGKNKPTDVAKVLRLLHKAKYPPENSTTEALGDAIERFQRGWNRSNPDGLVEPDRRTLDLLNQSTIPLAFSEEAIVTKAVRKGGYKLGYKIPGARKAPIPFAQGPYRVLLGHASTTNAVDITGRSNSDILGVAEFAKLLHLIEDEDCWGNPLALRLFVSKPRFGDITIGIRYLDWVLDKIERVLYEDITESTPVDFPCPVRPLEGKLLPLNEDGELKYLGDSSIPKFWGRMVEKIDGYDKYIMKWGGKPELENGQRGFDCITYAGTVFGAKTTNMGHTPDLAGEIAPNILTVTIPPSTESVSLENARPEVVKKFFGLPAASTGYYLLYSAGHVVIVADGTVHEFSEGKGGYDSTPVSDWLKPYKSTRLTVRRITRNPPLAR